jgi:adenosylcobinamide-GDP ribazoletransferase
MSEAEPWGQRLAELGAAFGLLTRLPVGRLLPEPAAHLARAVWAYPLVGAAIGTLGGVVYALAYALATPAPLAALWALLAMILATGAMHEDGLADCADGLAGGTPEERLAIMRDHRLGTYGVIALVLSLAMRGTAIALLAEPRAVLTGLVVIAAAGRASAAVLMTGLAPARSDGLSVAAGRPDLAATAWALGLTFALGVLLLSLGAGMLLLAAAMIVALLVGHWAQAKLGGQTGDVLGACCQISECVGLALLVALYARG